MALYVLLGLILVSCFLCLVNWRLGLYMMVLIAAVQDPLRKLVEGVPGYMTLGIVPVMTVAVFKMISVRRAWWRDFKACFPKIGRSLSIFIIACLPAAFISATYGPGSWLLTILGSFSYGVLIFSIIIGYHFTINIKEIRRLIGFYCIVSAMMLSGGVIEYLNLWPDAPVIGTAMFDMEWIRYYGDAIVHMIAGFYRTPDVMGWHAVTVVMMTLILAMTKGGSTRWMWFAVCAFAVVALLLCGRRKMVFMIPIFISAIVLIYVAAGKYTRIYSFLALSLVPVASVLIMADWLGDESAFVRYYAEGSSDTADSLKAHGIDSVINTVETSGFFGSGLGFATPGSQHLQVARPRTWQESGPSRIMVELGVPGFLALLGLMIAVLKGAWSVVLRLLRENSPDARYAIGFMGFFMANVGSLVVSGQILADSFIAFFLGFSIGTVLSFGRRSQLRMGGGRPGFSMASSLPGAAAARHLPANVSVNSA